MADDEPDAVLPFRVKQSPTKTWAAHKDAEERKRIGALSTGDINNWNVFTTYMEGALDEAQGHVDAEEDLPDELNNRIGALLEQINQIHFGMIKAHNETEEPFPPEYKLQYEEIIASCRELNPSLFDIDEEEPSVTPLADTLDQ